MSLKHSQAKYRRSIITQQSIQYTYHIYFPQYKSNTYTILAVLSFKISQDINKENKQKQDLFIDITLHNINNLHMYIINGNKIDRENKQIFKYKASHLFIPKQLLKCGEQINYVYLCYTNIFNTDQRGVMKFIQKHYNNNENNENIKQYQYIYTTLQHYYANRIFACFDQLDLKAKLNINVIYGKKYQKAIGNQLQKYKGDWNLQKYLQYNKNANIQIIKQYLSIIKIAQNQKQYYISIFNETPLIPTYIFSIIVGPFHKFPIPQTPHNIPMAWYCTQSQKQKVQKMLPYLFQTTKLSLQFLQKYFQCPYAFSKYDQIFVHQLDSCAVQNNTIVTYHDKQYIWNQQTTQQKAMDLADTMIHELIHHWFGNLVGIQWWNDLWLKQSFAQFFAYFVLQSIKQQFKIVKFQSGFAQLLYKKGQRPYMQDTSNFAHPIKIDNLQSTLEGQLLFNGIIYIKGSYVLKQLMYIIGEKKLSQVFKEYFQQYKFKFANANDFFKILQKYFGNQFGIQLKDWKKVWYQTPYVNTLQSEWVSSQDSKQKYIKIIQKPFSTNNLSNLQPHKIKIALFYKNYDFDVKQIFIPPQQQTLISIQSQKYNNYKAILINYQDLTYAKIIFDKKSQQYLKKNLTKINDILARTLIWRTFYDQVIDAKISSLQFIQIFINHIKQQNSDTLVQRNYQSVCNAINVYTPQKYREELNTKLFYFTLNLLQNYNNNDNNEQNGQNKNKNKLVILRQYLIQFANSASQLQMNILQKWYKNTYQPLKQYKVTPTNKWNILQKIITSKYKYKQNEQKYKLIEQLHKQHPNCKQKLKLQTMLIQSQQQFMKIFDKLLDSRQDTMQKNKYIMTGLKSGNNSERFSKLKQKYFNYIQKYGNLQDNQNNIPFEHLRCFIQNMGPGDDNLQELLKIYKDIKLPKIMEKNQHSIRKIINKLEKRIRAYQTFIKCL